MSYGILEEIELFVKKNANNPNKYSLFHETNECRFSYFQAECIYDVVESLRMTVESSQLALSEKSDYIRLLRKENEEQRNIIDNLSKIQTTK